MPAKKPTFQELYAKSLAARKAQCKCKGSDPSLQCPIHAKQAQAEIDLERKLNAKEVEDVIDYDFLGCHLLPKRHGYLVRFALYEANGKRHPRVAILWQCGENLTTTRHKFSIFADGITTLAEAFHAEPESVSLTKPFVFHSHPTASAEARRMIETQATTPLPATGEAI